MTPQKGLNPKSSIDSQQENEPSCYTAHNRGVGAGARFRHTFNFSRKSNLGAVGEQIESSLQALKVRLLCDNRPAGSKSPNRLSGAGG